MKLFKKYSTALRQDVIDWGQKLRRIDILIGIPCFNNEDTIQYVVETVAHGLKNTYPDLKTAVFVSDGGSLDNTREFALQAKVPPGIERMVSIYRGMPGKGTSFRAVFELAVKLNVEACGVVDADLRSIAPNWIERLTRPILEQKADFVAPFYLRHKYDGTITNNIVYPMTRALYGKDVRQPIGGDFGFSGSLAKFYANQDVWLTDVAKFGIDIWMTTTAINEGYRVIQSNLGVKIHDPKDPAEELGSMFQQVVSTLFYLMGQYESRWKKVKGSNPVELYNKLETVNKIPPVAVTQSKLEQEFVEGFEHFRPLYEMVISLDNFQELIHHYEQVKAGNSLTFPPELWCKILYDFAFTFQSWSRNRRRLVDIITPLYFGRVGAYCQEVAGMSHKEAEAVIQKQAQIFEENKSYLVDKYEAWE